MGKSTPSPPPPPDPIKTAAAQQGADIGTAIANAWMGNANETNPYGNVNYNQIGTQTVFGVDGKAYLVPRFERTVSLSPEQQTLYDQQSQLSQMLNQLGINQTGRLTDLLSSPIQAQNPQLSSIPQASDYTGKAAQDAMMARLQPALDRQKAALDSQLVNQGFQRGSEGYQNAMDEFNRQYNDAVSQAILSGQQYGSNEYANALQQAQLQNSESAQALQQELALRNQPINEISALMSAGQVSMPQFAPYQYQPMSEPPVAQSVYNSANLAQNAWATQVASQNAQTQGMYSVLAAIPGMFKFSDRRLKRDIVDIGVRLMNGLKLYSYRLAWETHTRIGAMADEVMASNPEAVKMVGGFSVVNYAKAM